MTRTNESLPKRTPRLAAFRFAPWKTSSLRPDCRRRRRFSIIWRLGNNRLDTDVVSALVANQGRRRTVPRQGCLPAPVTARRGRPRAAPSASAPPSWRGPLGSRRPRSDAFPGSEKRSRSDTLWRRLDSPLASKPAGRPNDLAKACELRSRRHHRQDSRVGAVLPRRDVGGASREAHAVDGRPSSRTGVRPVLPVLKGAPTLQQALSENLTEVNKFSTFKASREAGAR